MIDEQGSDVQHPTKLEAELFGQTYHFPPEGHWPGKASRRLERRGDMVMRLSVGGLGL